MVMDADADGQDGKLYKVAATVGVVFDDYVSNPVPGGTVVNGGTIDTFQNTFTGFVSPDVANTSVSPLPDPVGVLVDSSVGDVSFADWSSGAVISDILGSTVAQGQEITFTFVDPSDASQKATVSRVGFRFGSNDAGKVTARFFDEFGDEIFLQSLAVGQIPTGGWVSTGFASIADGIEQPLIHQVKINCAAGDIVLIGSFDDFQKRNNDMVFNSLTVPEPGTVTLLGIGVAALVSRFRRRRA